MTKHNEIKRLNMRLGDRIKKYEKTFYHSALKRMPLMIRVDGRAFHTFTKGMRKPFDSEFMTAMVYAATNVALDMQGFKAAYIQSDEATFCLTDYDTLETEGWFNYELPKVISISASMMTLFFNKALPADKVAVFDSRAFTLPKEDVVNAFLWRAKDWERNSLQMYCRSIFSHKELHKKKREDMHEMLYQAGRNWTTDLSEGERNGTFLVKTDGEIITKTDILPRYESINDAIGNLFVGEY